MSRSFIINGQDIFKDPDPFFHREWRNDIHTPPPSQQGLFDLFLRGALVALPFLSLIEPLHYPLAAGMGGVRVISYIADIKEEIGEKNPSCVKISWNLLHGAIATGALAATIFMHPLGMQITTGQDLLVDVGSLVELACTDEENDNCPLLAINALLRIVSNALYLALLLCNSIWLAVVALFAQVAGQAFSAVVAMDSGRCLEGVGHVAFAFARLFQLETRTDTIIERLEAPYHFR